LTDARLMVYNLLFASVSIVADDGTTVLSPLQVDPTHAATGGAYILFVKEPYSMKGFPPSPMVVVGPQRTSSMKTDVAGPSPLFEIVDSVDVVVICRDISVGAPFTLDGRTTRDKLVTSIKYQVLQHQLNPDGTGTWNDLRPTDDGGDQDVAASLGGQTLPLYRTRMVFAARRYSSVN